MGGILATSAAIARDPGPEPELQVGELERLWTLETPRKNV